MTCDVAEAECDIYYEPGYVGGSGCCHCDSVECDHSKETSEEACSYYAMPEVPAPAPERARAGEPAPLIGAEGVGGDGTLRSVAVQRVVVAQLYKHHEDMHRRRQRGATRGQLERAGSEPGARRGGGGANVGSNVW